MRTLFAFLMTSADGYVEGPEHEFDWPVVDEEFGRFSVAQLDEADTLLFGRTTYEGMVEYWTGDGRHDDPEVARRMDTYDKIVVSRSLERVDWPGTRIMRGVDELAGVKAGDGKAIAVLGSSELTGSLIEAGLLDELRVLVSPIVLGAGRPMLRTVTGRVPLSLVTVRTFRSGNVLLTYRPGRD
jgi:dihydrofolate reductase